MTVLIYLGRLMPAIGWLINAFKFPGLHCALKVEILGAGQLSYGRNVRIGEGTRVELPRTSIVAIADNVSASRLVHIALAAGQRISIGAGTTVQDGCRIYGDLEIGSRCIFAPNVFVSSGTHAFDTMPYRPIQEQERLAPIAPQPIKIFDDCWFGINSVLLPGITIGRGSVIGANTVVNSDLPPYSIAVGCPAQVVRQRLAFLPKSRIDANVESDWPYFYDGLERTSAANENEFVAHRDFTLAMNHPGPRAVRIWLAGDNGEVVFADHRQPLPRQLGFVEFELSRNNFQLPFLKFRTNGRCRIRLAELI